VKKVAKMNAHYLISIKIMFKQLKRSFHLISKTCFSALVCRLVAQMASSLFSRQQYCSAKGNSLWHDFLAALMTASVRWNEKNFFERSSKLMQDQKLLFGIFHPLHCRLSH